MKRELFGTISDGSPNGAEVYTYTLDGGQGTTAKIITLGAAITELNTPDRNGVIRNVIAGYDNLDAYLNNDGYLGAVVGRVAGRIRAARFELGGRDYRLSANDGENHLHGGRIGFDRRIWEAEVRGGDLVLSRYSPDSEEGYPGGLNTEVTYSLDGGKLTIKYSMTADAPTIADLTNHAYFNLSGDFSRSILCHELEIDADRYSEIRDDLTATGKLIGVGGTGFDFRKSKPIGRDRGGDYDNCFILNENAEKLPLRATLRDPGSGRRMSIRTDQPCIQLYTAGMLSGGDNLAGGAARTPHCALCIETQHMPGSANIFAPGYADIRLEPGINYVYTTVFEMGIY